MSRESTLVRLSGELFYCLGVECGVGLTLGRHLRPFKSKVGYRSEKARALVEQANLLHN